MDRLISEQAVLDVINEAIRTGRFYCGKERTIEEIKAIPSAEPKIGHWIFHYDMYSKTGWYECDCCHTERDFNTDFCPDCGAKMIEKPESEDTERMIQIDLEVPKCCNECKFVYDSCKCIITGSRLDRDKSDSERLLDCPLNKIAEPYKGMTNGEVIKAMFGDDKVSEFMGYARIMARVGNWFNDGVVAEFDKDWWNSPYEPQKVRDT